MIKEFCDKCGIELLSDHVVSNRIALWLHGVKKKDICLCALCWFNALKLLGYQADSGVILSKARGSGVNTKDQHPNAPDAGAMREA